MNLPIICYLCTTVVVKLLVGTIQIEIVELNTNKEQRHTENVLI